MCRVDKVRYGTFPNYMSVDQVTVDQVRVDQVGCFPLFLFDSFKSDQSRNIV